LKKDGKRDPSKWTFELWAEDPEGYDPMGDIEQMRSKVTPQILTLELRGSD
jgi:hypothetical protein